ncbi:filamentous hemagglutinin N-terminal domain-containing protein [Psittacicella gerlachiana]|uniref:Filamentous haemagglutinin FhaB/tRNA nuclease CdiA-like TPS domain-containing protein n=1 Tax=Psittacicella gerlachiana TaxID=2028574 RepID=A0A3A1YE92_9GAMM|nr:filamentous hemagglutinin N-terminal domain-containing protein [Psittacicella gerlachiana]RIY35480.1 hypothetical protein CKF59_03540 [Psittacicella gerlachiana]
MNRNFKLKFNRRTLSLDAVSELATSAVAQSTSSPQTSQTVKFLSSFLKPSLVALLSITTLGMSFAQPARTGMDVIHGQVQTLVEGTVTTYTTKANSIINWQTFNIKEHEIVKFLQEHANSTVLNRVLGGNVSQILGQLQSNGKVFIVNPAGIVFGAKAQVDVAGLVASTLDLSDEDFLQGKYVFNQNKDATIASVLNQGVIKLNQDGTLALVGGQAINTGVLEAKNGTVYLLAGQSITIQDLENPLISYKVTAENQALNLGSIFSKNAVLLANKVAHGNQNFVDLVSETDSATQATINAQGEVLLYAGSTAEQVQTTADTQAQVQGRRNGLVVQAGTIQGHNTQNTSAQGQAQASKVQVLGDAVVVTAEANIVAQEVNLGGDLQGQGQVKLAALTQVQAGATIDVSRSQGDAGTAIVWGDRNYVAGTFQAQALEGKGGFVETSGKELHLGEDFTINAQGTAGKGQWLLDPENLHIVNSTVYEEQKGKTGSATKAISLTDGNYDYTTDNTETYQDSYLLDKQVETALKEANVTLTATNNLSVTYADINAAYAAQESNYGVDGANGALSLTANNISITNSSVHTRHINLKAHNNVTITSSNLSTTSNLSIAANKTITVTGVDNKLDGYTVAVLSKDDLSLTNVTTKAGQKQPAGVTNVTSFNLNAKGNLSLTNVSVSVNFGQVRITSEGHKLEVTNSTLQNNWQEVMLHAIGYYGTESKNSTVGGELTVTGTTIDVLVNYYLKGGQVTIKDSKLKNQEETTKANQSTISVIGDGPVRLENSSLSTTSNLQFDNNKSGDFIFLNSTVSAQGIETIGSKGLKSLEVTNSSFNSKSSVRIGVEGDITLKGATFESNNFNLISSNGKISIGEEKESNGKVIPSKLEAKTGNANIKAEKEISLGNAEISSSSGWTSNLSIDGKKVESVGTESKNVSLSGNNVSLLGKEGIALDNVSINATRSVSLNSSAGAVSLIGSSVKADNVTAQADSGQVTVKDNKLDVATCLTLNGTSYDYQGNTGKNADKAKVNGQETAQSPSPKQTDEENVQKEATTSNDQSTASQTSQDSAQDSKVTSDTNDNLENKSSETDGSQTLTQETESDVESKDSSEKKSEVESEKGEQPSAESTTGSTSESLEAKSSRGSAETSNSNSQEQQVAQVESKTEVQEPAKAEAQVQEESKSEEGKKESDTSSIQESESRDSSLTDGNSEKDTTETETPKEDTKLSEEQADTPQIQGEEEKAGETEVKQEEVTTVESQLDSSANETKEAKTSADTQDSTLPKSDAETPIEEKAEEKEEKAPVSEPASLTPADNATDQEDNKTAEEGSAQAELEQTEPKQKDQEEEAKSQEDPQVPVAPAEDETAQVPSAEEKPALTPEVPNSSQDDEQKDEAKEDTLPSPTTDSKEDSKPASTEEPVGKDEITKTTPEKTIIIEDLSDEQENQATGTEDSKPVADASTDSSVDVPQDAPASEETASKSSEEAKEQEPQAPQDTAQETPEQDSASLVQPVEKEDNKQEVDIDVSPTKEEQIPITPESVAEKPSLPPVAESPVANEDNNLGVEAKPLPKEPQAQVPEAVNGIPVLLLRQGVEDDRERNLNNWLVRQPEVKALPTPPENHQPLVVKGEDIPSVSPASSTNETIFVFSSCKVTSSSGQAALSNLGVSSADMGLSLGEISAKYNLSSEATAALEAECK